MSQILPVAQIANRTQLKQLGMEAVKDSFRKTFAQQRALVPPDLQIPAARVVAMAMLIHFLATCERIFPHYWVRCFDQFSESIRRNGTDRPRRPPVSYEAKTR